MLAVAVIKLLVISMTLVGLLRLIVFLFIGDAQNELAIRRLIGGARGAWRRNLVGLPESKRPF
ncbi:hypothetical protein [Methylocystis bryophila]|nr:hypothetical protein [Methylocystis bryophila]BDV39771.1 hypothetical protein DSM21852_30240 [Methylocystis bryophila]